MFRLAFHRYRPRHSAVRVDQFLGRECGAALLALVAVGAVIAALGAGADNIAIGKESLGLFVIVLHRGLLDKLTLIIELAEEVRSRRGMRRRRGTRINIERHAQPFERILNDVMITIDDFLRRNALLAGLDRDRHAMFVRSADRNHIAASQPQITRINIRRNVNSSQMTYVYGTVGIGKRRSHQITFELFRRHVPKYCFAVSKVVILINKKRHSDQ